MSFVFSYWIIVAAVLLVGIVACFIIFFKMDRKDRVLIDEFIKAQQPEESTAEENVVTEETKENE